MRAYLFAVAALLLGLTAAQAQGDCALMQKLAQEHSNSMAQRNIMDHAGFEERARKGAKAENVAYGAATKAGAMAMGWPRPHTLQTCCFQVAAGWLQQFRAPEFVIGPWR